MCGVHFDKRTISAIQKARSAAPGEHKVLTIFSIPKAFRGHIDVIQRNAITSWTLLHPRPEIILLGDDEGTAAVAKELDVHHCPVVCRNEYGTPLVDDLFEKAHSLARNDVLCYANADIILMSDFMDAVRRVAKWRRRFLMIGRRWDVDVDKRLGFGQQWDGTLRSDTAKRGCLHDEAGIDYMVFRRGVWQQIPPFAIGRPAWDNWMVYAAHSRGVAVVDATPVVTAIHQNHVGGGERTRRAPLPGRLPQRVRHAFGGRSL